MWQMCAEVHERSLFDCASILPLMSGDEKWITWANVTSVFNALFGRAPEPIGAPDKTDSEHQTQSCSIDTCKVILFPSFDRPV